MLATESLDRGGFLGPGLLLPGGGWVRVLDFVKTGNKGLGRGPWRVANEIGVGGRTWELQS